MIKEKLQLIDISQPAYSKLQLLLAKQIPVRAFYRVDRATHMAISTEPMKRTSGRE